ncbi:hypothetical protein EDB80DRAFT_701215, partial [Ilyonectria destructans]
AFLLCGSFVAFSSPSFAITTLILGILSCSSVNAAFNSVEWCFSIEPLSGASDGLWRPELHAGAGGDSSLITMLEKVTMASVYPGLGSLEVPRNGQIRHEASWHWGKGD